MKKILLILVFVVISIAIYSNTSAVVKDTVVYKYCQVYTFTADGTYAVVDYGRGDKSVMNVDNTDKHKFGSPIDVLNYFSTQGWECLTTFVSGQRQYFLFRKKGTIKK
jgi:hypothetical protein